MPQKKAGFTLVELSIVLIIMGLIVAATVTGRELLNISRLKSVIAEIESYKIAVDNFKTQYENLPGDIPNATSFWTTAQNGGTAVANGNGDGMTGTNSSDYTEPYYLWSHLTLSKFVPGTFSGSSASAATPGVNVPASKYMDGAGFSIRYDATPFSYTDALSRSFSANYIFIGKANAGNNHLSTDFLVPADAYYIDSKIDDGTPDFGKMLGGSETLATNCTSGSAPNIIYNVSLFPVGCIVRVSME